MTDIYFKIRYFLVLIVLLFSLMPISSLGQQILGTVRIQGNNGLLNLFVISENDAINNGHGVVKIALDNGITGAAWLVSTDDPEASEVRIQTTYGTKAWRKYEYDLFTKTYGGPNFEIIQDLCLTSDGGMVVAGYTNSYGAGNKDDLLLKLTDSGNLEWGNAYGYEGNNSCRAIIQTSDNAYLIGGNTENGGAGDYDQVYRKLESDGDVIWEFWSGTSGTDACNDVIEDYDGNYVTVGYTSGSGNGSYDIWYRKMDKDHNSMWGYTYGNTDYDVGEAIIRNLFNGYAICGITSSYGNGEEDMILLVLDSLGSALNVETYGGTSREGAYDICLTQDSGYVLVGYTASFGAGSDDMYYLKVDASGNIIWSYAFGGTDYDRAKSVIETKDQGFAIIGETISIGAGAKDLLIYKTDKNGQGIWHVTIGGPDYDGGQSIKEGPDGCFYAGGYMSSTGAGENDYFLVKIGPDASTCSFNTKGSEKAPEFAGLPGSLTFTKWIESPCVATIILEDGGSEIDTIDRHFEKEISGNILQSEIVTPVIPTITTICD